MKNVCLAFLISRKVFSENRLLENQIPIIFLVILAEKIDPKVQVS